MIKCNLSKFAFIWNFHNEIMTRIKSSSFWHSKILFDKNKRNVFALFNNLVTN